MITLIDATCSSLTVSWPAVPGAVRYKLEYKSAADSDEYETLTNKLTTTQARKNNLQDERGFFFRVCAIVDEQVEKGWVTHSDPFFLVPRDAQELRMDPPKVASAGSNEALHVTWEQYDKKNDTAVKGYELQMRENDGGIAWKTIAPCLSGTEVRKKNLSSKLGYQFRVRPVFEDSTVVPFSSPCDAMVAPGLSQGMRKLFRSLENGKLLQNPLAKPIPLADALGGKEFVLLYASAHWCGPCRQFTPQVANWYKGVRKTVEVVFLSCDHDESGFQSYYSSMPWLAVDFDDETREQLMGFIRVTGIPRLVVLDGKTGSIIEDNAVGKPLDIRRWRNLATSKK